MGFLGSQFFCATTPTMVAHHLGAHSEASNAQGGPAMSALFAMQRANATGFALAIMDVFRVPVFRDSGAAMGRVRANGMECFRPVLLG